MAQVLINNGLKDGEHFGLCGFNNYEFITTLFGGLIVGGVVVPVNGNVTNGKCDQMFNRSQVVELYF